MIVVQRGMAKYSTFISNKPPKYFLKIPITDFIDDVGGVGFASGQAPIRHTPVTWMQPHTWNLIATSEFAISSAYASCEDKEDT